MVLGVICFATILVAASTLIYSNSMTYHQPVNQTPGIALSSSDGDVQSAINTDEGAAWHFSFDTATALSSPSLTIEITRDAGIMNSGDIANDQIAVKIGATTYTSDTTTPAGSMYTFTIPIGASIAAGIHTGEIDVTYMIADTYAITASVSGSA